MLRSSVNCSVMLVPPSALDDVMESRPAMVENCFSSGSATAAAMVSGLAPGSVALTWMVGKSTLGRSLTGNRRYANTPKIRIAAMISVVVMGRRINNCVFISVIP